MNGNVTSSYSPPDFPTMFRTISVSLGFDPVVLFIAGFGLFVVGLIAIKAPRISFPIVFFMYTFFGFNLGLVPAWIAIAGTILTVVFIGGEFTKALGRSLPLEPEPRIPWSIPIQEAEPEKVTVNCKNCGGPNVDRVTCEYCGLVLE